MIEMFKLLVAESAHTPPPRHVFGSDKNSMHEHLVDAVRAAAQVFASGLIPFIECDGVVFLPQHIQVLIAELDSMESSGA